MVFFLPCDHGLDFFFFDISLCENSINQSIDQSIKDNVNNMHIELIFR